MCEKQTINVGIGFATGRKNFQRVLRTYIYNFKESGLLENNNINFSLFIAYDLSYNLKTMKRLKRFGTRLPV